MNIAESMLPTVKANLILEHSEDDTLLTRMIESAIAYAESYQHRESGWYGEHPMPATTERAIVMLSSHFYESRDGSTAGFYGDNVPSAQQVWRATQDLLRMDRDWGRAI
ncbi:hypothetical protein AGMMS49992_12110 [Clostridia bacterium]|nr:hypothetical protein AGMMS49992_12110 [Clostridia bacterium]